MARLMTTDGVKINNLINLRGLRSTLAGPKVSPSLKELMTEERMALFLSKVEHSPTGCWLWNGIKNPQGYGYFPIRYQGKRLWFRAHRLYYLLLGNTIPENLILHHECKIRRCVNPAHLKPISQRENVIIDKPQNYFSTLGKRGGAVTGKRTALKRYCIRGHEFTKENTWLGQQKGRPVRYCKACYYVRKEKSGE